MACGPNLAPGRCDVPPSNGAPMISTSAPAQEPGSARSARGTPRNVTSGPYIPPSRGLLAPAPPPRAPLAPAPPPRAPLAPAPPPRPIWPPKISCRGPQYAGPLAGISARREPVYQCAVGGVGEVEAGISQVAQHSRGRLPNDDPAHVHPARGGARGGEQGRVAVVAG